MKIRRTLKECQNAAQEVIYLAGLQNRILLLELIAVSGYIIFSLISDQSIQSKYLNFISTSSIINSIIVNPTGGFTIFIGIISIIAVYLYFFTVLGKTKYFSEPSAVQEKYTVSFWMLGISTFLGGLIILIVNFIITKMPNSLDIALYVTGFITLCILSPIPNILKHNFYNPNLSEFKDLKIGEYNYKFLENFQKEKPPFMGIWTSDIILIMTFMWVGLALVYNCNIFRLCRNAEFTEVKQ